jgi:redox-sensitive bicupin YhaK (pirin superfamily)
MNTSNKSKITIHRAVSRGGGDYGWLKTFYSFSFGDWYNPARMGFGALRVINDDIIAEGAGFGTHAHANMEIITIPTKGTLAHKDSTGGVGKIEAGKVQVMSAGTGVRHSEYNGGEGRLELFQIWVMPNEQGVVPRYDEREFTEQGGETLLVAPMGHEGTLNIHQDAYISRIKIDAEGSLEYTLKEEGNGVYFFLVSGDANIEGETLTSRDAIGVENLDVIPLSSKNGVDIIAIEVPMR